MPERDDGKGHGPGASRTRVASFYRAIVVAAVAAAAPAAGCYESDPGHDAVSDADGGRDEGTVGDVYGVPWDADDTPGARYSVPMYGAP